jgi:hypothetical protein
MYVCMYDTYIYHVSIHLLKEQEREVEQLDVCVHAHIYTYTAIHLCSLSSPKNSDIMTCQLMQRSWFILAIGHTNTPNA